jgi:hypothetical protein
MNTIIKSNLLMYGAHTRAFCRVFVKSFQDELFAFGGIYGLHGSSTPLQPKILSMSLDCCCTNRSLVSQNPPGENDAKRTSSECHALLWYYSVIRHLFTMIFHECSFQGLVFGTSLSSRWGVCKLQPWITKAHEDYVDSSQWGCDWRKN